MPKLFYYMSAMNAGKTTHLLQADFNYNERGMNTLLFIPEIIQQSFIISRIGIKKEAIIFNKINNLFDIVIKYCQENNNKLSCIFVDEAQFLTRHQVLELCKIVDELSIPVLCYGLRSDFKGCGFEGSDALFHYADKLIEIKTICKCGKKAIMNHRTSESKNQIDIGGNDKYISLCRKCFININ
jgi:thymidine kinase